MEDLKIIEELEIILNKKLKKLKSTNTNILPSHGYSLNELSEVTGLSLAGSKINNLNTIINQLNKLKSLTYLNLNNNEIIDLAPLKSLKKLTGLSILRNKVKNVTPIKELTLLRTLNLGHNNITTIKPLENLSNLRMLWLIRNQVKDIQSLNKLKLTALSLGGNEIENIDFLKFHLNLKTLHLQENQIKNLKILSNLIGLDSLMLQDNQISDLSGLENLKKVKTIALQDNPIKDLPLWITQLYGKIQWSQYTNGVNGIFLYNNPISSPPLEIVKQGKAAIKRYFEKIIDEGVDYIFEAKLTLVGEGSAGKTSLQKRLLNSNATLPRKDNRTRGIEIKDWKFNQSNEHIAHIWDFGGQDVYYPVHRFFLTENSVFVLLASTRQTSHNFDYWIPTIYQFGGKSPIILVQTCDRGNKISWGDIGFYLSNPNFNIVKTQLLPYFEVNLINNNEGLDNVKNTIKNQIENLPHYGKGVPKSWVSVRNILFKEAKKAPYISFETFKFICKQSNTKSFSKVTDFTDCCQFLHDIGVVLWYSKIEELKSWVILQPQWAMNAVYRIIDDNEIQNQRGIIKSVDFKRLWIDTGYEDMHSLLKKMLEVFKIAFPKKHIQENYIMPVRLLIIPNEKKWDEITPCLRLEYRFEFMPKGIVNQLSAELSKLISSDNEVWNNAVNFSYKNNAQSQVEELFYNRKITIKSKGKDSRGLMILIMEALDNIISEYKGVTPEIYVPCICPSCKDNPKPTSFLYNDLLRWSEASENEIVYCNEGKTGLNINELLHNVGLPNSENKTNINMSSKTITIFLASSSELKSDREQFEIFINRENKRLQTKDIFLNLEVWEDFIDSISPSRLQDEYNTMIKNSDIFISLFFSKVGKYTSEEFDTAFKNFKKTGKPLIYTYFKTGDVDITMLSKKDLESKELFQEKLSSLGHFFTLYKNIDDLKYKFKMQLEKVIDLV